MRASSVLLSGLSGGVLRLSHLCRSPCSSTLPASLNTECWRGLAPGVPVAPSPLSLWASGGRHHSRRSEGQVWALPVPPLPGSGQMVAAVPWHEAWLALSRRQHPGAGAGQESRITLPHPWGAALRGRGAPALPDLRSSPSRRHAVSSVISLVFPSAQVCVQCAHTLEGKRFKPLSGFHVFVCCISVLSQEQTG